MRASKLLFLATSIFTLGACASANQGGGAAGSSDATSNMITAEQISDAGVATAYDAVDRLHRDWLTDITGQGDVQVYLAPNTQSLGGVDQLKQFPAQDVQSIEYVRGPDAVTRFSDVAKGGALVVTRK